MVLQRASDEVDPCDLASPAPIGADKGRTGNGRLYVDEDRQELSHKVEGCTMLMLTADHNELALLEEKRCALIAAMDRISIRFVALVAAELPDRWEEIVCRVITDYPHEAKSQGSKGLSRLKSDLRRLQARAAEVASEHVGGPWVWEHQEDASKDKGRDGGHEVALQRTNGSHHSSRVSAAIADAENEVLTLLHPLFADKSTSESQSAQNRLSRAMEQMVEAYERLLDQLKDLDEKITEVEREIAIEDVHQLWEDA